MALQGHSEPQPANTPPSATVGGPIGLFTQPQGHCAARDLVCSRAWPDPSHAQGDVLEISVQAPGGSSCRKEAVLPRLRVTRPLLPERAILPVCAARLAGSLATDLSRSHSLLPPWVDLKEPPPPSPPSLLLLEDPGQAGCHGAQSCVGTCERANGARGFCPEMGQNESLSEERGGHESKRKSGGRVSPSSHPTQAS
ncbi:LOW QUALITY PROTEIN: uncharacterized protein C9orf139 homolog [Nomascus leucogenys]|uniref:LOW QUALITY PROTEIN: uncharacterized protein C9orf139 homolog n=1 Tax=Nomascus leucogenys TaxID=61853 RepID=UPI00122D5C18|nr:LOW QUALITY PROTEIN: uncharacterized protein C9orf139 homolog [Nomascus leucogenys]